MASEDLSKLRIDDSERLSRSSGKRRRRLIRFCLFIGFAGASLALLHHLGLLTRPIEVRAVKVSKMYVTLALTELNAGGYVVAQRKAAVSSKATGRLAKLHVEEGKIIKKGDMIASLENEDLMAALEEARAALRVASARLKNAEAELHDATINYERNKPLRESGAISAQAFDTLEARYKKAAAADRSARFEVERAEAGVKVAELSLEYSYIRAPFDGVILTKNADEGEVVAPFGGALNAKAAVVTMADMNSLLVEVDVSESSLEKVKVGGACEIRLDALPNDRFAGTVHMIVPTADRSKATVLTKVRFNQLDKRVLPEMSAKVAFLSRPPNPDEAEPFVGVHKSALRSQSDRKIAFVVEGRTVRAVPVETGRQWGEIAEVLGGLKEGDMVVVEPDERLVDGTRITLKE